MNKVQFADDKRRRLRVTIGIKVGVYKIDMRAHTHILKTAFVSLRGRLSEDDSGFFRPFCSEAADYDSHHN